MYLDAQKRGILSDILRAVKETGRLPEVRRFRIDHEDARTELDELVESQLVESVDVPGGPRYGITLDGLRRWDSDEARAELRAAGELIPILRKSYQNDPRAQLVPALLSGQLGKPAAEVARALTYLRHLQIWQSFSLDWDSGLAKYVTPEDPILDIEPDELMPSEHRFDVARDGLSSSATAVLQPSGRLKRIELENYRCFEHLDLELAERSPIVLIGPNAVGKTTVLEAIELLSSAAGSAEGLQDAIALRGGLAALRHWGDPKPIRIKLTFAGTGLFALDGGDVEYEVVLDERRGFPAAIFEEVRILKNGSHVRALVVLHSDQHRRWLLNVRTKSKQGDLDARDTAPPLGRGLMVEQVRQDDLYPTVGHVRSALGALSVYGHFVTTSGWLALPFERTDGPRAPALSLEVSRLHPRGLNLVNALHTLQAQNEDLWNRLCLDFQTQFPHVQRFVFAPLAAGGRIALQWRHSAHRDALSLDYFSDGMLAWLCFLATLYLGRTAPLVAFDEPETHLHPTLLQTAVGLLEVHAQSHTSILVATHSDRLLDALEHPAEGVRIVRMKSGKASLEQLDHDALLSWLTEYRLGELRARGHLDVAEHDL